MSAPLATTPETPAPDPGPVYFNAPEPAGVQLRRWLRAHRFWLLVGGAVAVVLVVLFVLSLAGSRSQGTLAVDNPAPAGGMAVAKVLGHHGVDVRATDSLEATLEALESAGAENTTVLLHDPSTLLSPGQLARLAAAGTKVVALAPGPLSLKALAPDITPAGLAGFGQSTVDAQCTQIDAATAESITSSGGSSFEALLYRGPIACFTDPATGAGAQQAGLYATTADGSVVVLGNPAMLSNEQAATAGNAALVLRTLGSREVLLWYTPSLKDLPIPDAPPTLASLTPGWVLPAGIWLMLVAALAMFWRGRRDGPLVPEPLPVLVKSAETVAGRARLYQRAGAVERAADNLRSGALLRIAAQLRLDARSSGAEVAAAVAAHSPLPPARVHEILTFRPSTEKALLSWVRDLEALEKEATGR
ncbi:DUF4350 domain-containing protein [Arthrobacter sp. 35W]|uniref:DUF4350 domain-containing protein n=1 Tax=Arthrobacter sp. 35W TaxID=1132441 RepID=UPI00041957C3|nr:DUF4350 domain-containing protein [Arthrobacter sp. 35W]